MAKNYSINELHEEISLLRQKLDAFIIYQREFNGNHLKEHKERDKNIKWWIGTSLVFMGLIITFVNIILNTIR